MISPIAELPSPIGGEGRKGEGEPRNWREQTLILSIFERTSFDFSNSRAPLSHRERETRGEGDSGRGGQGVRDARRLGGEEERTTSSINIITQLKHSPRKLIHLHKKY